MNNLSKYNFSDAAKRCSSKKYSAQNKLNNFILLELEEIQNLHKG